MKLEIFNLERSEISSGKKIENRHNTKYFQFSLQSQQEKGESIFLHRKRGLRFMNQNKR